MSTFQNIMAQLGLGGFSQAPQQTRRPMPTRIDPLKGFQQDLFTKKIDELVSGLGSSQQAPTVPEYPTEDEELQKLLDALGGGTTATTQSGQLTPSPFNFNFGSGGLRLSPGSFTFGMR